MSYILIFFFFLSVLGIAHSYIFFPISLEYLSREGQMTKFYEGFPEADTKWSGKVSVIMSCYNEAAVLPGKIRSLQEQDYPTNQLQFYIGSDASSDGTAAIIQDWAKQDARVQFQDFQKRRGKGPVINDLARLAIEEWGSGKDHVLLFTDANVLLDPDCILKMVRHFRDARIGVVDSHMLSVGVRQDGISSSEKAYIQREVRIKHLEGQLWGCMIGTFGGCYALRSDAFTPVPENFLVDDFYITMEAIFKGFGAVNDLTAYCREAVSHEIGEEYRRKRRISSGNFQNLMHFWPRVSKAPVFLRYCFISHKVLRWLSPVLLLLAWLSAGFLWLWDYSFFGFVFIMILLVTTGIIALDRVLERWGIHWPLLRHLRYFIWMNIAVFAGFIQYLHGIESNVWQPPKRQ